MPPVWPGILGAPSKKKDTGTCRILEICCNRLAPIRLVPFSYFCTCWKVRPRASPSFSWLIDSIMRRIRTRRMMLSMSQEKLGDALGLTFQQVQKYEKGTNRIGASRLQQISHILQVPVAFFFEGAPSLSP